MDFLWNKVDKEIIHADTVDKVKINLSKNGCQELKVNSTPISDSLTTTNNCFIML